MCVCVFVIGKMSGTFMVPLGGEIEPRTNTTWSTDKKLIVNKIRAEKKMCHYITNRMISGMAKSEQIKSGKCGRKWHEKHIPYHIPAHNSMELFFPPLFCCYLFWCHLRPIWVILLPRMAFIISLKHILMTVTFVFNFPDEIFFPPRQLARAKNKFAPA